MHNSQPSNFHPNGTYKTNIKNNPKFSVCGEMAQQWQNWPKTIKPLLENLTHFTQTLRFWFSQYMGNNREKPLLVPYTYPKCTLSHKNGKDTWAHLLSLCKNKFLKRLITTRHNDAVTNSLAYSNAASTWDTSHSSMPAQKKTIWDPSTLDRLISMLLPSSKFMPSLDYMRELWSVAQSLTMGIKAQLHYLA